MSSLKRTYAYMFTRPGNWALTGVVACAVMLALISGRFQADIRGWILPLTGFSVLVAVSWFYSKVRKLPDNRIPETLHETAMLVAFSPFAAGFQYMVAANSIPLIDAQLASIDDFLGFHWPDWYFAVTGSPVVEKVLLFAYASSLPHIAIVLIATGLTGHTNRTRELISLLVTTSLFVVIISGLAPAEGAWTHFGIGVADAYHLEHFRGLRGGTFNELTPAALQGIITFPSFHTVISLVILWTTRRISWLFIPSALLACLQLLSIPVFGGHYLSDMLAGAIITVLAILGIRASDRSAPVDQRLELAPAALQTQQHSPPTTTR